MPVHTTETLKTPSNSSWYICLFFLSSCPCVTFYVFPRGAGGDKRSLLRGAEHVTTPHSTSGSEHKMLRRKTLQVSGRKGIELVHAGTWHWGDSVRIHVFVLLDSPPGWISSSARALSYKWYHTRCFPVPNHRCLRSGWTWHWQPLHHSPTEDQKGCSSLWWKIPASILITHDVAHLRKTTASLGGDFLAADRAVLLHDVMLW